MAKKFNIQDLKNITPTGEVVLLPFESDYDGNIEEFELRVYPLTVEEKVQIDILKEKFQKLHKKFTYLENKLKSLTKDTKLTAEELDKKTDIIEKQSDPISIELGDILNQIAYQIVYFTVKKTQKDITPESTKNMFTKKWNDIIVAKVGELEGITPKEKN